MKKYTPLAPSQIGILVIILFVVCLLVTFIRHPTSVAPSSPSKLPTVVTGAFDETRFKSDADWKKILTSEQYHILRQAGTEIPFTGALLNNHEKGTYLSAGCNLPVFRSEDKYDSGTGWPSFTKPITTDAVVLTEDTSLPGESRIEVLDRCGGHLGHVFDDGPQPTKKRYCMNSAALIFVPDSQ